MKSRIIGLGIVLCVICTGFADWARAADFAEGQKLVASDRPENARFGDRVSISDNVAIVGSWGADSNQGAAYIYRFDGTQWVEEQKLVASDGEPFDQFGRSVDVEGDVAIVGSLIPPDNAVYIFRYDGSSWVEEQKIIVGVSGPVAGLGWAVALSGDTALISEPFADSFLGAAYVYRFDGSQWTQEQKLTASVRDTSDGYAASVALDGDIAMVGANADAANGAVYAYRFDGSSWVEEQRLSTADGAPDDNFGTSISIDEDRALISARDDDSTGSAYVFEFDGSVWTEEHKLTAADLDLGARFGNSVSLKGDTALIGASREDLAGAAYIFGFDGLAWTERQKLVGSDSEALDEFGGWVALSESGRVGLIGAGFDDEDVGSAYLFLVDECRPGTVNAGAGEVTDTLYVNGSTGGAARSITIGDEDLLVASLIEPPAGGNGKFALHASTGSPTLFSQTVLPFGVGTSCFPFLLSSGGSPVIVANNIGKTNQLGESNFFGSAESDPARATTSLIYPSLPVGTVLTLQAVIIDPGTGGTKGASMTNAVVVEVVP